MLTITNPTIEFKNRGLTHTQLQQVLDYIHTHLDRDLSLAELAETINISPTYFANEPSRRLPRATGCAVDCLSRGNHRGATYYKLSFT